MVKWDQFFPLARFFGDTLLYPEVGTYWQAECPLDLVISTKCKPWSCSAPEGFRGVMYLRKTTNSVSLLGNSPWKLTYYCHESRTAEKPWLIGLTQFFLNLFGHRTHFMCENYYFRICAAEASTFCVRIINILLNQCSVRRVLRNIGL